MQLSKIKLSGFKSFVDPTTIPLPSQLIAIVGPNGCGKSNVIDAVTWVLGENSPKYLRGESSTDVVFNGSTARKPVGQASVELIFDNADSTMGNEFTKFTEISVKRVIDREANSAYYLNGVRCRKRDVMDIFLGTGLGPRSYSIIGQNMIGRIIEAKPEDLRTYIEEAAGISKYKERRHETELRIQHTKENLARINDVRTELEKQLSHLKHQANVAEKFKTLKQQERVLQAELYAIQWRQLDGHMVDYTLRIQREQTALEARQSELSTADREMEQLRHEQRVSHDAFQEVQRRYYAVGNEITRIEQDILHQQERQRQWEQDLQQAENDWQSIQNQMQESEDDLHAIEHDIQQTTPQFATVSKEASALTDQLEEAEENMQTWQQRWDEFNQLTAKTAQTAQVEKTRIQHIEQKISLLQKRQDQLQQDQARANFSNLSHEAEEFSKKSYEVADKLEFQNKRLTEVRKEISTLQATQQDSYTRLDVIRNDLQRLHGQQASLEALQQTALGQRDNAATPWINKHGLATKPRLAQHIDVEKGWELAAEKALGFALQAVCVDQLSEVVSQLDDFKAGNICIFTPWNGQTQPKKNKKGTLLLEKITSPCSLESLLANVYVADSLKEALALCEQLDQTESVMTRDGIWLSRAWLKIFRETDVAAGVFEREQELKQLATRIEQIQATQKELEKSIEQRTQQIDKLEQQRDQLQQTYNQYQAQAAQFNVQQKMKQEQLVEMKLQVERFVKEQEEGTLQLNQARAEYTQAREIWQQALTDLETQATTRDALTKEREDVRNHLHHIRELADQKKESMHELQMRLQTTKSQKTALQQAITRLQQQLTAANERKNNLQSELSSMPPLDTLKKSLSRALDKHVSVEVELNTTRVAMESLEQESRNLEERRQNIERDINKVRTILESLRVEWQGWKVKADTLIEQLKGTEFTLETILKDLPAEISADEWQGKLEQVVQRIQRLGPINLVAIEEYATCLERKEYLDRQLADLQAGLETLEAAIAKIDRETRARFKETFDKVNARFQELFPTVFGGGKAYLELTSDNLLEAGITMMACPPGKRNTSVYLLSGGEKSLTAIALIFSIFHLNPAPFCMLDEVDAALDDANVVRFTRLVKAMTENTQFIYISHNKITIEMAEHLIGVTMNEPGVSRLVSVDIEKAMDLAGV